MAEGTSLGKAYIQIVPSTKGIGSSLSTALNGECGDAGTAAGEVTGKNLASKLLKVVSAAAIGTAIVKGIKASIDAGAELEQSIGGIETLFGDSAEKVKENAENAWKTVGLSANDYMESVTSFSASLLQSLDGDTNAAADSADQALTDMSDNANKFGTDMESIQNAYQGFAKQNYTMLDNLKLGYGGTKSEMERLLADAQEISGQSYDISNLNDVYSAIHVIQTELGVTGTTASEAASTLTGSAAAVKSAWTNVLGSLATGDTDMLNQSMKDLASSASTLLFDNLFPAIGNIITQLPGAIATFLPAAWESIKTNLAEIGGKIGPAIKDGFFNKLPELLDAAPEAIDKFADKLQEKLDSMSESGGEMLNKIGEGFQKNFPKVMVIIGKLIAVMLLALAKILPKLLKFGFEMLGKLLAGMIKAIPTLLKGIGSMFSEIGECFKQWDMKQVGIDLIKQLIEGIKSMISDIGSAFSSVGDKIKEKLGLGSSSESTMKQAGYSVGKSVAAGIDSSSHLVSSSLLKLSRTTSANLQPAFAGSYGGGGGNTYVINGVTYDDGSNVASAVGDLCRAIKLERRV